MMKQVYISALLLSVLPACAQEYESFDDMTEKLLSHSVDEVMVDELSDDDLNNYVVLDARDLEEYKVSHLKGAFCVGYDDFDMEKVKGIPTDAQVLVYCSVGYRSEKVAEQLEENGYTNVVNLVGGIFGWVNEGKPIVGQDNKETDEIHGYSEEWGVWLTKGQIVYE